MICCPIVATTKQDALEMMGRCAQEADLLELRVDLIKGCDLSALMRGRPKGKGVIVTNRRREEGGGFAGSEEDRVVTLMVAVALGAEYVDIEARTEPHLIELLKREIAKYGGKTRSIISYHDMEGTPDASSLQGVFEACKRAGGDIIKVCTFAKDMEDNLTILGLIPYARRQGKKVIAFCMGEKGRLSRVVAPLLGSYISYCALQHGAESAPGQLTVAEMREVLKILRPDKVG